MICDFTSFSKVFQSYQDDERFFESVTIKKTYFLICMSVLTVTTHIFCPLHQRPAVQNKLQGLPNLSALDKREYLMVIFLIFLLLIKTICCDTSSEPSHRDGSDEGSQRMFLCRINKNYP